MNNRQLIADRGVRFYRFAGTLHLMIYTEPKEDRNYKTMHFDIDDILIYRLYIGGEQIHGGRV